jgi:hypothetical protein
MKLVDLDPEWVSDFSVRAMRRYSDAHSVVHESHRHKHENLAPLDIAQAQGVLFLCPACFVKNGGPVGTESVLCWFRDRGVPDDALPGPGPWTASGTGFDDLTLSPSVNVTNGHWHGFVTNGEIR